MLFKTVYGPELHNVHNFISNNGPTDKDTLYESFLPVINGEFAPKTNLDDAISFLISANLVYKNDFGKYEVEPCKNFRLKLLENIRDIQLGRVPPHYPLDPWYLNLIDEIYVSPNRMLAFRLHQLTNATNVCEVLSEERVNAWRRVLEYLGLGNRINSGFLCSYDPQLIWEIILEWDQVEGPLDLFLEEQISKYLPWRNKHGDISDALRIPLQILVREKLIKLERKQDSPYRGFLGDYKWILKEGDSKCFHVLKSVI